MRGNRLPRAGKQGSCCEEWDDFLGNPCGRSLERRQREYQTPAAAAMPK
jgi:hypothetical protein